MGLGYVKARILIFREPLKMRRSLPRQDWQKTVLLVQDSQADYEQVF